jgi:transposase
MHIGWVELHYRNHKQLHRYLYSGWKLSSELRFKLVGSRVIVYLTFTKHFEVEHNPRNAVAVDVNENNATVALFKSGALTEVYRVETNLGRHVIEYSERRKRITGGNSAKVREVGKKLKELREGEEAGYLEKDS